MNELLLLHLFQQDFIIDSISYKPVLQLYISIKDQRYARILLLHNKMNIKEMILIALDSDNNKIIPIPLNIINKVIRAIKNVPFPDKLSEFVKGLSERVYKVIISARFIKISNNISALVSSTTSVTVEACIELELSPNERITPGNFVFAAFDGINTNIYFELDNEFIDKNKAWGILSKICFYFNNEYIGDFYTQNTSLVKENSISFLCKTKANLILNNRKLAGLKVEGVDIFEISDFIVSSAGLYNSISLPDGYRQIQSWYTIIIPIIGLQIPDEFGIGSIEFCTKCNDEIKRAIEYNNSFDDFDVFALVHINSEKMYSALVAARRQIEQSVDLLISILKDDSLYSTYSLGKHISERAIDNFQRKVSLSPLVYIEAPFYSKRLFCNLIESVDTSNLIVTEHFLHHKIELEKAELLLMKANGTNDKEITPLFNSLKWIRKAWDSNDFEDKIINCIIALEFIVSKEPNIELMGKSVRKRCTEAIGAVIQESQKDDSNKEEYLKKIIEKFHRAYTETPFMVKLTNLISKLCIPVSEDELRLITSARTQRNEIIHGKNDILLPTDEIYKLCECIGRIAFYKINSLEV